MYGHHCRHNTTIAGTTAPTALYKYLLYLCCHAMKHSSMAVLVHFPYFTPRVLEKTGAALVCRGGPKWCLFDALHPEMACRCSFPHILARNNAPITLGYAPERLGAVQDMNVFWKNDSGHYGPPKEGR